jgi:SEC-C motif
MTMILALGNRDHISQLADRRSTSAGRIVSEEEGKAGALICADARMLFGLTGLARTAGFETRRWLLDAFYESSPGDGAIWNTLQRFKDRASEDFGSIPSVRALSPVQRRLSILFTGYLFTRDPPLLGSAIVSNFMDPKVGKVDAVAADHFSLFYTTEKTAPRSENPTYVQRVGAHRAMNRADEEALRRLLADRRPARAVTGKATEIMLAMADRDAARGTIGKQITWLTITPERDAPVQAGYYSNVPTRVVYTPLLIVLDGEQRVAFDMGTAVLSGGGDNAPLAVPRVSRNAPCPCNSGRKYKRCHGG